MKQDPTIQRIAERMAPGILCRDGFLGSDARPLEEIVDTDRSTVEGLGTSHQQLAQALQDIFARARAGLGTTVQITGRLRAVYRETMGRIPCPWGRCGTFPKGEVELIDTDTAESIRFTMLSIHMIAEHGFYQGKGSPYRIDPATIQRLLGGKKD